MIKPTIDIFICLLCKDGQPKEYFPDLFFSREEANLWAKQYLNTRSKKKLGIKVEQHTYALVSKENNEDPIT